ncbi:hypothetical protein J6U32_13310 [Gordonia polyisoprenivorans]|nr:hypothetical protein [Gordonia polyisoprenivorans]QTI71396.1 hypothetical protein J6U32_13310 [Gordonia polyisoprenivorans]
MQPCRRCRVGEQFLHHRAQSLDELGAEVNGLVVLLDGGFDKILVVVRCVARMVLGAAAEEVVIVTAVTAGRALHDDSALDSGVVALAAEQAALQVVV